MIKVWYKKVGGQFLVIIYIPLNKSRPKEKNADWVDLSHLF